MSRYRRAFAPGGAFFFTVNLADRRSAMLVDQIDLLRTAYRKVMIDTIIPCQSRLRSCCLPGRGLPGGKFLFLSRQEKEPKEGDARCAAPAG
jgi:hypothetical protein